MSRRIYDRSKGRKSKRFIDRTGMIAHRLLYLEWLGQWGKSKGHWWKALCECGKNVEAQWRPSDVRSCGCLNDEKRRTHGWETQRPDGRWGLGNEKRLRLADGTETTAKKMCEQTGLTHAKMLWRVRNWPEHRWLEPKHYTGAASKQRGELIAQKARERVSLRRPQPWAVATMKRINEEGLAYRKTKPASALPPAAGPGQAAAVHPGPADDRPHAQEGSAADAAGESLER